MVTRDQLWHQLGKRPFQPFRVTLSGGESIDVFRRNQAIVTSRQFIVAVGEEERTRWVPLDRLERLELYELRQAAP